MQNKIIFFYLDFCSYFEANSPNHCNFLFKQLVAVEIHFQKCFLTIKKADMFVAVLFTRGFVAR